MRKFTGEVDFHGRYYDGRARRYVMSMNTTGAEMCPICKAEPTLPLDIWYETDMEGRPLRFGELGQNLAINGYLHDTDFPLMYEEFYPGSFIEPSMQAFSDSVFDVPEICKTSSHTCKPGRMNRERRQRGRRS